MRWLILIIIIYTLAKKITPNHLKSIANINLATKNLASDYSVQMQAFAKKNNSPKGVKLFSDWTNTKKLITKLSIQTLDQQTAFGLSMDSLQKAKSQLEKQLMQEVAQDFKKQTNIDFTQIKSTLKTNEIAIDFFDFFQVDEKTKEGYRINYGAIIISPVYDTPQLVLLLNDKTLQDIFGNVFSLYR